jgi:hypothetical protein
MGGAFGFGLAFNGGTNAFWDNWNRGVCVDLFTLFLFYFFFTHAGRNADTHSVVETMEGYKTQIY